MAENTESFESGTTDFNKDGSPRKRRGRKPSSETVETPEAVEVVETGNDRREFRAISKEEPVRVEHVRGRGQIDSEAAFIGAVTEELETVFARFGPQDHAYRREHRLAQYRNGEFGEKAQYRVDAKNGNRHWDNILLEEVYEALSADTVEDAYDELVQVAAMATLAAVSLKRNGL